MIVCMVHDSAQTDRQLSHTPAHVCFIFAPLLLVSSIVVFHEAIRRRFRRHVRYPLMSSVYLPCTLNKAPIEISTAPSNERRLARDFDHRAAGNQDSHWRALRASKNSYRAKNGAPSVSEAVTAQRPSCAVLRRRPEINYGGYKHTVSGRSVSDQATLGGLTEAAGRFR